MNLRVTGVGKGRSSFISTVGCGDIATHGIGRKVEYIPITTGCQYNGMGRVSADFASHHIAHNNALGMSIDQYHIQHFRARKHLYLPQPNLSAQ